MDLFIILTPRTSMASNTSVLFALSAEQQRGNSAALGRDLLVAAPMNVVPVHLGQLLEEGGKGAPEMEWLI